MTKLYEQFFNEVKKPSITYVDKNDKIDREVGRLSVQVSRDKEDALHKRMKFHRDKYKYYKKQIMDKYSSKVKSQARK
jgi:hypothetical protein